MISAPDWKPTICIHTQTHVQTQIEIDLSYLSNDSSSNWMQLSFLLSGWITWLSALNFYFGLIMMNKFIGRPSLSSYNSTLNKVIVKDK